MMAQVDKVCNGRKDTSICKRWSAANTKKYCAQTTWNTRLCPGHCKNCVKPTTTPKATPKPTTTKAAPTCLPTTKHACPFKCHINSQKTCFNLKRDGSSAVVAGCYPCATCEAIRKQRCPLDLCATVSPLSLSSSLTITHTPHTLDSPFPSLFLHSHARAHTDTHIHMCIHAHPLTHIHIPVFYFLLLLLCCHGGAGLPP